MHISYKFNSRSRKKAPQFLCKLHKSRGAFTILIRNSNNKNYEFYFQTAKCYDVCEGKNGKQAIPQSKNN